MPFVDGPNIELPRALKDGALDGDTVADAPFESLGGGLADDGAFPIAQEGLPLVVRDDELGEDIAIGLGIDGELGKEVPLVLIDPAEPVGEGRFGDVIELAKPLLVGDRQRLDQRDPVAYHEAIGAGDVDAGVEAGLDGDQQTEEKERHRDGTHRQDGAGLLSLEIAQNERQELHGATSGAAGLHEDALLEMEFDIRSFGRPRIVGHHENGLPVLFRQAR